MADAIRRRFETPGRWLEKLSAERRKKISQVIADAKSDDGFVDEILFTQFCDKSDIIRKGIELPRSKTSAADVFRRAEKLRNAVAHGNDYAMVPSAARNIAVLVRDMMILKREIDG
ncbi:hypothetical protein [Mesorhizobium sp.]|uniref:hypothetical protein n=1 Tax=Mesorhizobium sp. TaxID=1871066 RepID=UPI000FE79946|nr:hypothetical protein [Mesorhizobium sp.]RWP91154.1 MAG: hypothetical protein EOR89_33375 [Mesorhizobium sp.]